MGQIRLELLLSPGEEISIFNSETEMKVSDFSEAQLEVFRNFVNLTGKNFATIENVPNEELVVFWHEDFQHDENYAIDEFHGRISLDYDLITEGEIDVVNAFAELINSIK